MVEPGDTGGDCARCDTPAILIGHGHTVVGSRCPDCGLLQILHGEELAPTGGKRVDLDK